MSWDDAAVGGFFEDLTVLLFVMVGVAVIVSASVWTAHDAMDARADEELGILAEELLTAVLREISPPETIEYAPSLDHIKGLDLFAVAAEIDSDCQFCISATEHHPDDAWLFSATRGLPEGALRTAYASGFVNALDPMGMVAVVEVMVLVW
ncbi:MAG: hypothetical protein A3K75_03245 [Euryarchaeota archaeon RBG_13_61_15]|nr:MAG: hypothetical protein A3K75_03245 [Euryarchaeota archaeon RBG_13_61_15]